MLSLLISLSPLIAKLGLSLIDIFIKDEAARAQAKKDFLSATCEHLNDALKSVTLKTSYAAQLKDLKESEGKSQDEKTK